MTHIRKLGLLALVSLFIFVPAVSHAQSHSNWDYERVSNLENELDEFWDSFEEEIENDGDVEDAFGVITSYLEDFEIPTAGPLLVEEIGTSAAVTDAGSESYATYTVKVDITAVDSDIYIAQDAGDKGGSPAVEYRFHGEEEKLFSDSVITTGVLTSTADKSGKTFRVREGDTERFTLTVVVNPSAAATVGLVLEGIRYGENTNIDSFKTFGLDPTIATREVTIPGDNVLDTYKGYLDGKLFITTKKISESAALENCKLNDAKNPTKAIRCTWGGKEIYRRDLAPTGTIGTKSLSSTGASHIISGTANNTPTVGLVISNGDKVYGSGPITVRNGKWSVKVPALAAGTYSFSLYEEKDRVIASASLKVEEAPLVLPASTKTDTSTVPTETSDQPLVLPAETTGSKSSVSNQSLSASAAIAFEELLAAFKEYLKSR